MGKKKKSATVVVVTTGVPEAKPEAKVTGEVDHSSPEQLAKYDAATVRQVTKKEKEVAELEAAWSVADGSAKNAKKAFEAEREALRKLIRDRQYQRGKAPPKVQQVIPFEAGDATIPREGEQSPLQDLWKQYPEDMLFARVITRGVRRVLPGVFSGSYSAEEYADIEATNTSAPATPAPPQETPSGIPLPPAKPLKPEAPPDLSRPTFNEMVNSYLKDSKVTVDKPSLYKLMKEEVKRRGIRALNSVVTGDDLTQLWTDPANDWLETYVAGYIKEINSPAA